MLNSTLNGDSTDDDKRFNASNNGFGLILGQPIKSRGGGDFLFLVFCAFTTAQKAAIGQQIGPRERHCYLGYSILGGNQIITK